MVADMRIETRKLGQLSEMREGFVLADLVLRDTLEDYARGRADVAELLVALEQHRMAYADYLQGLYACIREIPEA